jgi:malate synthase
MLDETVPLASGSHRDVVSYSVEGANLLVRLRDGTSTGLARPAQFAGYRGEASAPIVMKLMTHHRVRHMPVLRDGKLAGIISIGDVM